MIVLMQHPMHGQKHCYSDAEVAYDEQYGWFRVSTEVNTTIDEPPEDAGDESLSDDLRTQYIAKFGKPPHHRMSEKTIREKVAE